MTSTLRGDPRRPYLVTDSGVRRIVLGESRATTTVQAGDPVSTQPAARPVPPDNSPANLASRTHAGPITKPLRTSEPFRDHLLVLAYSERGVLDEHPRQTVAAAALIANPQTAVVVVVLGDLTEDIAPLGADIVVVLPDCDSRTFQPDYTLARVSDLLQRYRPLHVLLPDGSNGEGDLGRRLAATQGASIATHVVELTTDCAATYHRLPPARLLARRPLTDIILLAPDVVDTHLPFVGLGQHIDVSQEDNSQAQAPAKAQSPARGPAQGEAPGPAEARAHAQAPPRLPYRDAGLHFLDTTDLPLEEADLIAAAGNGVTDVALFERLAKVLGAATGASRVAVDDGRFAREKQIGATGKTVSANVYLAIGISGAVQHLQGIKDCRHVIAINRDSAAPIIQRADLSVIGDAQALMHALVETVDAVDAQEHAA